MKFLFLATTLILSFTALPALAREHVHHNYERGGKGTPGPIAGAGIIYVAIGGGYYMYRRWRIRGDAKKSD